MLAESENFCAVELKKPDWQSVAPWLYTYVRRYIGSAKRDRVQIKQRKLVCVRPKYLLGYIVQFAAYL